MELITPVFLIATKLAAFENRGCHDFWASHDLEDIVTVIDGRSNMVEEIERAGHSVRNYIASCFSDYAENSDFLEALCAYLDSDTPASRWKSCRRKIASVRRNHQLR